MLDKSARQTIKPILVSELACGCFRGPHLQSELREDRSTTATPDLHHCSCLRHPQVNPKLLRRPWASGFEEEELGLGLSGWRVEGRVTCKRWDATAHLKPEVAPHHTTTRRGGDRESSCVYACMYMHDHVPSSPTPSSATVPWPRSAQGAGSKRASIHSVHEHPSESCRKVWRSAARLHIALAACICSSLEPSPVPPSACLSIRPSLLPALLSTFELAGFFACAAMSL